MFEICCRLCLEQVPLNRIHSLYGKHKEFIIRDKISELFQIEFTDTEKLSTVCNTCLEKIDTVNSIRTFFLESDRKFQSILKRSIADDDDECYNSDEKSAAANTSCQKKDETSNSLHNVNQLTFEKKPSPVKLEQTSQELLQPQKIDHQNEVHVTHETGEQTMLVALPLNHVLALENTVQTDSVVKTDETKSQPSQEQKSEKSEKSFHEEDFDGIEIISDAAEPDERELLIDFEQISQELPQYHRLDHPDKVHVAHQTEEQTMVVEIPPDDVVALDHTIQTDSVVKTDKIESQPNLEQKLKKSEKSFHKEDFDEIEIISDDAEPDEHELLVEEALDVCFSESDGSVYNGELAQQQMDKSENAEFMDCQRVVIYTSEQSCDIINLTDPKVDDLITNDECSISALVEVDNEKSASLGVPGDDQISIIMIEYQCNVCTEIFEDKIAFIRHTNTAHYLEYPHHCRHCLLVFKTVEDLKDHACSQKPAIFKCSECSDRFQTVNDLRFHMQHSHGTPRQEKEKTKKPSLYKCDFCVKVLQNNRELLNHGQLDHPNEFMQHPCTRCEKIFGNAQTLRAHLSAHEKNYECSFCGKVCPTAVSLAGHENTHTKDQPFQCSQCGRNFAQYTSMRRHMKIHFNEKSYQCDLCSALFRQRSVMLTHRRIHTGEKPYTCGTCNKSFRDHSTLAKHRKVHAKGNKREK